MFSKITVEVTHVFALAVRWDVPLHSSKQNIAFAGHMLEIQLEKKKKKKKKVCISTSLRNVIQSSAPGVNTAFNINLRSWTMHSFFFCLFKHFVWTAACFKLSTIKQSLNILRSPKKSSSSVLLGRKIVYSKYRCNIYRNLKGTKARCRIIFLFITLFTVCFVSWKSSKAKHLHWMIQTMLSCVLKTRCSI